MLKTTNFWEMQSKTTMRYDIMPVRMAAKKGQRKKKEGDRG